MDKIWTIAWHMIKRTIGSRKGILIYILFPCLVIAGIVAISGGAGEEPTVVLYGNGDQGAAGKHLLAELERTGEYKLIQTAGEQELKDDITGQKGQAGLWIPTGYTADMLAGQRPLIRMYELKTSEASVMLNMKMKAIADKMQAAAAGIAAVQPGGGDQETQLSRILQTVEQHTVGSVRTDYNLYPREGLGVVTGMTLMFLMALVTSTVSLILDDRKGRTMMRMYSAPVRAYEIAIGNFLGSFMVGLIQIVVVLLLGRFVLQYDYELPLYLYFLVLAAFMLVSMGIASTVAGLIRNPNNAGMLNMLILTPTCMLGGCFWPISIMPDYMQKAANFVPQKWALEAVDIAATGGGWNELWLPFAILGLMAAVLLAIGSAILRPSEAGINA
ncbi:ABC transporter permease [Paenibacillus albidus]|uniref:ABC transporter permease n=1 Tax=Paenibacillus albidus TaxID=2041023 RepID=UPI001BE7D003|nr:ABC transporter permease [Paenibacillus albidus]MBT2291570.1 ABC transporter permease [Paenibacillus albidus]